MAAMPHAVQRGRRSSCDDVSSGGGTGGQAGGTWPGGKPGWRDRRRRGRCDAGRERRRRDVSVAPLSGSWLAAVVEDLPPECGSCCCCCAQWARSPPADAAVVQSWSGCLGQAHPTEAWGGSPVRLGAAVARVPADAARRSCRVPDGAKRLRAAPHGRPAHTHCEVWMGRGTSRESEAPLGTLGPQPRGNHPQGRDSRCSRLCLHVYATDGDKLRK